MAFTLFNKPGSRTSCPSASSTFLPSTSFTRPFSRKSKATLLARRVDVVFKFTLYATKKSRAPITVAPLRSFITAAPKSGCHSGCANLSRNPSYSPARMVAKFCRSGREAAASYKYTGMDNSLPTRSPNCLAYATVSSMLMPLIGIKGHTSVAPIRGCSPRCVRISINSAAF